MKNLFLILFLFYSIPAFSQVNLDLGLVGHFPFNGSAADISGNNNHGTIQGATFTPDRFGNANSALDFNGIDNYVYIHDSPELVFTGSYTFSLWMIPRNLEGQEFRELFIKGAFNTGEHDSYGAFINPTDTLIHWWEDESDFNYVTKSDTKIFGDSLYHIVCGFNSTSFESFIYINSELIDSKSSGGKLPAGNTDTLFIGAGRDGSTSFISSFFDGVIDDMRIYNRALNPTEISALYSESQCPGIVKFDTTIYYVPNKEFEAVSPRIYFDDFEIFKSETDVCDSLIYHYSRYEFLEEFYTDTIYVSDTTEVMIYDTIDIITYDTISVTDTLILDVIISGTEPDLVENRFLIYPNPASDILYISTGKNYDQLGEWKIRIINISGSVIFESFITSQVFEIEINEFQQLGLFLIQIIDTQDQIIKTGKILLE